MIRRSTCLGFLALLGLAACTPVTPHYGPPGSGYRMGPDGRTQVPESSYQRSTTPPVVRTPSVPRGAQQGGESVAPVVSAPAAPPPATFPAPASSAPVSSGAPFRFAFQVGDEVGLSVWKEKDLDTVQRVQRDGTISPMLLGTLQVAGRSVDEVRAELEQRYTEYLREPKVSVRVVSVFNERAYVLGEVNEPAAVPLVGPASLLQVLAQAGGMDQENADMKRVRIVRSGADGKPALITANVAAILMGQQPAPSILPGDVIYVAPTGLSDWSRGMTQALGPLTSVISSAGSIITSLAAIKALED